MQYLRPFVSTLFLVLATMSSAAALPIVDDFIDDAGEAFDWAGEVAADTASDALAMGGDALEAWAEEMVDFMVDEGEAELMAQMVDAAPSPPDGLIDDYLACGDRSDGCTDVPDTLAGVSVKAACVWHDHCYANLSMSKAACDEGFHGYMVDLCLGAASFDLFSSCYGQAQAYAAGVAVLPEAHEAYEGGQAAAAGCDEALPTLADDTTRSGRTPRVLVAGVPIRRYHRKGFTWTHSKAQLRWVTLQALEPSTVTIYDAAGHEVVSAKAIDLGLFGVFGPKKGFLAPPGHPFTVVAYPADTSLSGGHFSFEIDVGPALD